MGRRPQKAVEGEKAILFLRRLYPCRTDETLRQEIRGPRGGDQLWRRRQLQELVDIRLPAQAVQPPTAQRQARGDETRDRDSQVHLQVAEEEVDSKGGRRRGDL